MKINLLAIGTKMPAWVTAGYEEYRKRLPKDFGLQLTEIPAQKRTKQTASAALIRLESEMLFQAVPNHDHIIALERSGKAWDTQELAAKLQNFYQNSQNISLLIGGPEGIDRECLARSHEQWSLSPLTLPHPLVRIIVAEQIYRAFSILQHHPYHR